MTPRRLAILAACHNRKATTLAALERLRTQQQPDNLRVDVIVVDDGSTDGTGAAIRSNFPTVRVLDGDGELYWNGAMTLAQRTAMSESYDFHLWLNDDVALTETALSNLVAVHDSEIAAGRMPPVVVGSTLDPETGLPSYGGHIHRSGRHPFRFDRIFAAGDRSQACDTFNGNCVLIPASAFKQLGPNDPIFSGGQPLGDTDYGLRAKAAGIPILLAPRPVGTCRSNDRTIPWRDHKRSLMQRLTSLGGPLGPVRRQTLAFYRRHGGVGWPFWLGLHLAKETLSAFYPAAKTSGRLRVAMIEPVLPWYRLALLNKLAERETLDVEVYHGTAHPLGEPDAEPPPGIAHHHGINVYWPQGRDRILWCTNAWGILRGGHDVVLMPEHIYTLSNWLIHLRRRVLGTPRILLTGHFRLPPDRLAWIRRYWVRQADALAPYTESGAANCQTMGVTKDRIVVLGNTLDVEEIRRGAAIPPHIQDAERTRLGLQDQTIFLFIGRLYPDKRSPLAAEAVWELARSGRPATLLVVGGGEDSGALEILRSTGCPVHLLGEQRDPQKLALWFAMASAVVMPDAAGLAVVSAFAHDRPVVLGPGHQHGVEVDYVRHGENGLMAEAMTAQAIATQLRRLLDEPGLWETLRCGARATADQLSMARYAGQVEAALERASHD